MSIIEKVMEAYMKTLQEIEAAIAKLSDAELYAFRAWFEAFDARIWDEQLERDVALGKLDKIAKQAISDFNAGKRKEL